VNSDGPVLEYSPAVRTQGSSNRWGGALLSGPRRADDQAHGMFQEGLRLMGAMPTSEGQAALHELQSWLEECRGWGNEAVAALHEFGFQQAAAGTVIPEEMRQRMSALITAARFSRWVCRWVGRWVGRSVSRTTIHSARRYLPE
jgi:hypothetical protein